MSACQNCEDSQSTDTSLVAGDKCKVCKPYASLSINARLLLHFHNKLDHIGMRELTDLARQCFLPKCLSLAEHVVCTACQIGKVHKKAKGQSSITKKRSIRDPGDLIQVDQAESTNPGRPLTHSGRNSTKQIHVVTIFVDSISHKVYAEFQQSTGAAETVASKHEVEIDAKSCGVNLKAFRADNGIFKSEDMI